MIIFTRGISSYYEEICKMCTVKYIFSVLYKIGYIIFFCPTLLFFLTSYRLNQESDIYKESLFPSSIYVLVFDLLCLNSSSVFSIFLITAILTAIMLGLKGIFRFISLMPNGISFPYIHTEQAANFISLYADWLLSIQEIFLFFTYCT